MVGLVRNKVTADVRIAKEGIRNVTILQADITDQPALRVRNSQQNTSGTCLTHTAITQQAATQVSQLTEGELNYLINNAAYNQQSAIGKTMVDL